MQSLGSHCNKTATIEEQVSTSEINTSNHHKIANHSPTNQEMTM